MTSVIGTRITLNDESYTVVGVAPRGFTGPELQRADVWLPMIAPRAASRLADDVSSAVAARRRATRAGRRRPSRAGDEATTNPARRVHGRQTRASQQLVASVRPLWFGRGGTPSADRERLALADGRRGRRSARDLRQRREPAHRARASPASRDRGAPRARRRATRVSCVCCSSRRCSSCSAAPARRIVVAAAGGRVMRATLLSNVAWNDSGVDARVFAFTLRPRARHGARSSDSRRRSTRRGRASSAR